MGCTTSSYMCDGQVSKYFWPNSVVFPTYYKFSKYPQQLMVGEGSVGQ